MISRMAMLTVTVVASGALAQVCPSAAGTEGGPMSRLAASEFTLVDTNEWTLQYLRLAVLRQKATRVSVDTVLADGNRHGTRTYSAPGVSCFHTGFTFDTGDATGCWRPQGLSGSADAFPLTSGVTPGGRKALVVTWHPDGSASSATDGCPKPNGQELGSRVSFVDVTSMNDIDYRHVLLVEPSENAAGLTTLRAVNVHAGGAVWLGRYFYVVDTRGGLRVFDTEQILRVNDTDLVAPSTLGVAGDRVYAFGYKYVLPQVGRYRAPEGCATFSWASLDQSGAERTLITGEFKENTNGRILRWPVASTGKLVTVDGLVTAVEARLLGQSVVQGALSQQVNGFTKYFMVRRSALVRKNTGGVEATFDWSTNAPQNLHYSPFSDNLWGLDEFAGRPVWACKLATID